MSISRIKSRRWQWAAVIIGGLVIGGCTSTSSSSPAGSATASPPSAASSPASASGSVAPPGGTSATAPFFSQLPSAIQKAGTITVGSSIDYPPFEYYAADGKTLQGFETELATALQKPLGITFSWQNTSFDTMFTALRSDRFDVVYGAVNDTIDREKTFDFVDYLQSSQGFDVAKGNPQGIKTLDDLCGKSVAAVRGGIQADFLTTQSGICTSAGKGAITVLTFDGNSGEQLAVTGGHAAALLENYPTAATFASSAGSKLDLVPNLQVRKAFYGMVLNKSNSQLRDVLAKAWQSIIDDGTYGKILAQAKLSDIGLKRSVVNGVKSTQ